MFNNLYFHPFYFFAGPTPDGSLLWTFGPEEGDSDTYYARSYTSATLALTDTLGPFDQVADLGGDVNENGGAAYATDGTYLYFISSTSGPFVSTLRRLNLSSGAVSSLHAFDTDDAVDFMSYCHPDGRLYLSFYDDSAGTTTLRAINVDGTGFTGALTADLGNEGNPVWAAGHVWLLGGSTLYAYNIATTGVTTLTPALDAGYGNLLISNGSVVGRYGSDFTSEPINYYWIYSLGDEDTVNEGVTAVMYDPYGTGDFMPLTVAGGGCQDFIFSGAIEGGGNLFGGPYAGKQDASGASWFHGSFGTYANYWRFG